MLHDGLKEKFLVTSCILLIEKDEIRRENIKWVIDNKRVLSMEAMESLIFFLFPLY